MNLFATHSDFQVHINKGAPTKVAIRKGVDLKVKFNAQGEIQLGESRSSCVLNRQYFNPSVT